MNRLPNPFEQSPALTPVSAIQVGKSKLGKQGEEYKRRLLRERGETIKADPEAPLIVGGFEETDEERDRRESIQMAREMLACAEGIEQIPGCCEEAYLEMRIDIMCAKAKLHQIDEQDYQTFTELMDAIEDQSCLDVLIDRFGDANMTPRLNEMIVEKVRRASPNWNALLNAKIWLKEGREVPDNVLRSTDTARMFLSVDSQIKFDHVLLRLLDRQHKDSSEITKRLIAYERNGVLSDAVKLLSYQLEKGAYEDAVSYALELRYNDLDRLELYALVGLDARVSQRGKQRIVDFIIRMPVYGAPLTEFTSTCLAARIEAGIVTAHMPEFTKLEKQLDAIPVLDRPAACCRLAEVMKAWGDEDGAVSMIDQARTLVRHLPFSSRVSRYLEIIQTQLRLGLPDQVLLDVEEVDGLIGGGANAQENCMSREDLVGVLEDVFPERVLAQVQKILALEEAWQEAMSPRGTEDTLLHETALVTALTKASIRLYERARS